MSSLHDDLSVLVRAKWVLTGSRHEQGINMVSGLTLLPAGHEHVLWEAAKISLQAAGNNIIGHVAPLHHFDDC